MKNTLFSISIPLLNHDAAEHRIQIALPDNAKMLSASYGETKSLTLLMMGDPNGPEKQAFVLIVKEGSQLPAAACFIGTIALKGMTWHSHPYCETRHVFLWDIANE